MSKHTSPTHQTQFHGLRAWHDDQRPLGFGRGCAKCDKFWTGERAYEKATAAVLERALRPAC